MGKFTKISEEAFGQFQFNAGVILKSYDFSTSPEVADENIVCDTTGNITVTCAPSTEDMGSDVNNCPENMAELKVIKSYTCTIAFTALNITEEAIKLALGAADVSGTKITPRHTIKTADFQTIAWAGDRMDGGAAAVELLNAMSTGGLSLSTSKNGKGQLSVTLTGHYSIKKQDEVPMNFYVLPKDGE